MAIADPNFRSPSPRNAEDPLARHQANHTHRPDNSVVYDAISYRAPADEDSSLALGPIDDLTKYRIVEFLLACRSGGDAAFIAQSLGFHSVEWTTRALRDLTVAGLCTETRDRHIQTFRLAAGALTRSEVQQLRMNQARGRVDGELFRSLATSSLRRARQRALIVGRAVPSDTDSPRM
ncbi:MAG TPA: hypothetical protein VMP10_02715 [Chloroflexota bacterium]|nr:hypothetical protein [Chloroflexota bacterium]